MQGSENFDEQLLFHWSLQGSIEWEQVTLGKLLSAVHAMLWYPEVICQVTWKDCVFSRAILLCRTELFPYEQCIFYTVVTCLITLDRVTLKEKVVDAPEILTVIDIVPHLSPFLTALYDCDYRTFFEVSSILFCCLIWRMSQTYDLQSKMTMKERLLVSYNYI